MNDSPATPAFGAPGIEPRWTSSAKDGIGTAYSSGSNVWFTLSHGIINEIYYPHVDSPNTRDLQYLITDGETFCHEEKRDLEHQIEYPETNALLYRITSREPGGRYRIVKEVLAEPHSPVVLVHTRVEIDDPALRGKLQLYVLLAPHLKGTGRNNSADWQDVGGRKLIHAWREDTHLMLGCSRDFTRRSVGYVGASDGWKDLMDNFRLDWEFGLAEDGNLALTGEIDLSGGLEFTVAVAFGETCQSAATRLLQALATPLAQQREKYVAQWGRARSTQILSAPTNQAASLVNLSQCILLAHEDKAFPGAFVASLSIPWGETKDDSDRGGYHLVWTRDMVHTASALLACGETESSLRALIWLSCVQDAKGGLPQNSSIAGEPYWHGSQLDEVAAPILLAWRLRRAQALRQFDPWHLISRAAGFLIRHGPVTGQERWEENSGYSPSTLATIITALVCAADFATERGQKNSATLLLDYADWMAAHLEDWTVTTRGELLPGKPRHYLRITPADPADPVANPRPDDAQITLANARGTHPARNVIGGDFLLLVRLGLRDAHDPLIVDSVAVVDAVLKRTLPQGPGWRRYNHDGYGQKPDGSAYDGTGEGRCWPILSGERGHYELAAGRAALPYVATLEKFANAGGMLPEQLWDADDLPGGLMRRGGPTGSAMPLCWSHAEYLCLVRSCADGKCFDRAEPVYQRYVANKKGSTIEMWTPAHQLTAIPAKKSLRIILAGAGTVHWSGDNWATIHDTATVDSGLDCWWADLPATAFKPGGTVKFTYRQGDQWIGCDFAVAIQSASPTPAT